MNGKENRVRILTDSTCDLPVRIQERYRIAILPCFVNFGERSYLDNVDITRAGFYQAISENKTFPKTSAPSVGMFQEGYLNLARQGAEDIISIHIRRGLSNMSAVARLAAESCREAHVHVVEVGQVAISLGYLVLNAAIGIENGQSIEAIIAMLNALDRRSYIFAALETVEFLKASGRASPLLMELAGLLRIKPVLGLHLGEISLVDRMRTSSRQVEVLRKLALQQAPLEWIGVAHTRAAVKAAQLASVLKELFHWDEDLWVEEATPVLGVHVGPGALAFACVSTGTK
jgi:DegV family protein with EDD domain